MTAAAIRIPADTTHQAESVVYGRLARQLNRWTGLVILGFIAVHVVNEATLRISPQPLVLKDLHALDTQPWAKAILHLVEGLLYTSVAFHSLYGLRLIALDLGVRLERHYRSGLWLIAGASLVPGLWQVIQVAR